MKLSETNGSDHDSAARAGPFADTIRHLAARWEEAGPLLRAFPLLARGEPLATADIARVTGESLERVERAVESGRCERDAEGRLIDLFGMTLTPTPHRLEIDQRILFSCCALWAHVIPKLVDRPVLVESVDPNRRELVRLSISGQGVAAVQPRGAGATMAIADREAIETDIATAFCSNVRHFVSRESAEEFASGCSFRKVVDLTEIHTLAGQLYDAIWAVLEDDRAVPRDQEGTASFAGLKNEEP